MDVNNDGHVEVLVAVSYYFDKEEYSNKELDFDPSMYVAGGLALWDLQVRFYYILFYFILFYLSCSLRLFWHYSLYFLVVFCIFTHLFFCGTYRWELLWLYLIFYIFYVYFWYHWYCFDHDNYCCGTYRWDFIWIRCDLFNLI